MQTQKALESDIGTMKEVDGKVYVVKVGAFMDKHGECYSELRWYRATGKEARRYSK